MSCADGGVILFLRIAKTEKVARSSTLTLALPTLHLSGAYQRPSAAQDRR